MRHMTGIWPRWTLAQDLDIQSRETRHVVLKESGRRDAIPRLSPVSLHLAQTNKHLLEAYSPV